MNSWHPTTRNELNVIPTGSISFDKNEVPNYEFGNFLWKNLTNGNYFQLFPRCSVPRICRLESMVTFCTAALTTRAPGRQNVWFNVISRNYSRSILSLQWILPIFLAPDGRLVRVVAWDPLSGHSYINGISLLRPRSRRIITITCWRLIWRMTRCLPRMKIRVSGMLARSLVQWHCSQLGSNLKFKGIFWPYLSLSLSVSSCFKQSKFSFQASVQFSIWHRFLWISFRRQMCVHFAALKSILFDPTFCWSK